MAKKTGFIVNNTDHNRALDGFRALAVILVAFHHAYHLPFEHPLGLLAYHGTSGVDLFFVLSGFLITGILIKERNSKHFYSAFYMRRALRIIPLYYAVLVLAFILLPFIFPSYQKQIEDSHHWPYWFFLSNFSIALKKKFSNGLVDLSWSLCIEEQFYLVFPLLVRKFKELLKPLALTLILACPLIRFYLLENGLHEISIYVLPFTRADALAFGVLLNLGHRENKRWAKGHLPFALVFTLALVFAKVVLPHHVSLALGYSLSALIAFSLLGVLLRENSWFKRLMQQKYLVLMGLYSYGIYLLHNPIQKALFHIIPNSWWQSFPLLTQLAHFALTLLITTIVAGMSYHLFESYFLNLKKKWPYQS